MKTLYYIICLFFSLLSSNKCMTQNYKPEWDNVTAKNWPDGFFMAQIVSSADGSIQKAICYKSSLKKPQPLIVSLHTWSGDYNQEDPLAREILLRDWNYIHPDFRGVNNKPEACGSQYVISDIEDAINFAVQNFITDSANVHIIGVSGGGYATMLAFMKLRFPVKSFNAWVGISNLEEWYYESVGRQLRYASDLEGVTTNGKGFDAVEARRRSPVFMDYQPELRKNSALNIYTGIHDGYTGSVPITQSTNMFNKLLKDIYPEKSREVISDSLKLILLEKRMNPGESYGFIGERLIHLQRILPKLSITVFEGGHEMLVTQALSLLPAGNIQNMKPLNILTIGDSNGASENGWPVQIKKLLPYSTVINKSISGNTIGFDNLGQEKLNTLKNIEHYLNEANNALLSNNTFDFILIGLGTNDAKKIFERNQKEVTQNLDFLIKKIKDYYIKKEEKIPTIVIISPPPMEDDKADKIKYEGGNQRIEVNNTKFKKVAGKNEVIFIDIYQDLKKAGAGITTDGVHLTEKVQFQIAEKILMSISGNSSLTIN